MEGRDKLNERIKELRKSLGITQEKFANRINIKRNTLANYEIGRNEPIDAVISLICREFNVNENWLRYGEGEMFIEIPEEDEYFKAATLISKADDKDAMDAIIKYWKLEPESKKAVWDFIYSLGAKK